MSREATQHLRDAAEILGERATPAEVILAAEFIRLGYLGDRLIPVLQAIGVERLRRPEPADEPSGPAMSAVSETERDPIGFSPTPEYYYEEERRRG